MARGPKPRIQSDTADVSWTTRNAEELAVDVHVGGRIRLRRSLLGMSQMALADSIGLTFQQVQKYERGFNRVSASKLHRLSRMLEVPVGYFFDGLPGQGDGPAEGGGTEGRGLRRQHLELVRYFDAMAPDTARSFYDLAKALAKQDGGRAEAGDAPDEG